MKIKINELQYFLELYSIFSFFLTPNFVYQTKNQKLYQSQYFKICYTDEIDNLDDDALRFKLFPDYSSVTTSSKAMPNMQYIHKQLQTRKKSMRNDISFKTIPLQNHFLLLIKIYYYLLSYESYLFIK